MARRTCTNCGSSEWPRYRWCEDCWRAGFKAIGSACGTAAAAWLIHWLRIL